MFDISALALSLMLLAASGDQFVIGVDRLAVATRMRPAVVGALLGGLGASLPELAVAGIAQSRGAHQLASGSLIGSIVANVCLALAIAALVAPVRVDSRTLRREAPISVGGVLIFALMLRAGMSFAEGAIAVVALAIAVVALARGAGHGPQDQELSMEVDRFFKSPVKGREIVRILAGLAVMLAGSELLVSSASGVATSLGVGEDLVGLTIVAVGTSAPLVVIAIQAARRGNHDLVVGHVLGSNLFIALGGAMIMALSGGSPANSVNTPSVWLMASVTLAAWAFMSRGKLLTRWEATALILTLLVALPIVTR